MSYRRLGAWLVGALALGAGVIAFNIARSPLTFSETYHMLRFGVRSYLQDEPDYDLVEEAVIETGSGSAAEAAPSAWPAPTWTDFRGPGRLGIYAETPIRREWPAEGLPLVWRRPAGAAYGSLTVAAGLVFSLEQRREQEQLVAYDFDTGDEVWSASWEGRFDEKMSGEGPRATPVWAPAPDSDGADGAGVIHAVSAFGVLRTFDARSGAAGWQVDLLAAAPGANLLYGLAGSPLIHGDLVVVPAGAPSDGGGCLLALDRADGALVWRAISDAAAYSSALAAVLGGREQLLFTSATRLSGVDPETGTVLWSFPWEVTAELTCSQPVVIDGEHVLLSAGYGKGSALVRVRREGDVWTADEVWKAPRLKTRINPAVLHEGLVYGLDEGVLGCFDPLDGRRVWKGGRYGLGQVLLAGGDLLVLTEDGALALVSAAPDGWDERARFQAIEGLTMSIPSAAHGRLLVRNKLEIACFELAPPGR